MKTETYEYRIMYRNKLTGKRHTIFAKDQAELIDKLTTLPGHLQVVDRNPELPRV